MNLTSKPLLAALVAGAVILTGCSTVEQQGAANARTTATQPTRAEAAAAKGVVEQATRAVETFTAPGNPLKGVKLWVEM